MRWAVWGRCPGSHRGGCGPSSLQVFDQHYQTKRSRVMLWALSTPKIIFCFKDLCSYECKYCISWGFFTCHKICENEENEEHFKFVSVIFCDCNSFI